MNVFWHAPADTDHRRGKRLFAALARDGHRVAEARLDRRVPDRGLLLFGYTGANGVAYRPLTAGEHRAIEGFQGKVAAFSFDDPPVFEPELADGILLRRADAWLKVSQAMETAGNAARVPPSDGPRPILGLLPPFLPRVRVPPPFRWKGRDRAIVFYAAATGPVLPGTDRNLRAAAVEAIQAAGLPLRGGIIHPGPHFPKPPAHLRVEPVDRFRHGKLLRDTMLCLAPAGNNPVTKRFLEILASGGLALTTGLEGVRWLRGRLRPGEHYVAIADDLSDLAEKAAYYLDHPDEAEAIARRGHEEYVRYYHPGHSRLNLNLWRDVIESAGGVLPGPRSGLHERMHAARQRLGETALPALQLGYRLASAIARS